MAVAEWEKAHSGMASMVASWVTLFGLKGDTVTAGLPPSRALEMNILQQDLPDLEKQLSRVSGRSLRIDLVIRDDAREPEDPTDEPPVPEAGPPAAEEAAEPESETESPEDFYNDPLIRRALEIFDAKVVADGPIR